MSYDRIARLLVGYLPSLAPFRGPDGERPLQMAEELIRAGLAACQPRTVFEFAGGHCLVDGVRILSSSKGLPLAWLVLAAHRHRLGELELAWIFQGKNPHRSLSNTINRAANDAERYSLPLGSAIRGIGTEGGRIVVKGDARSIVLTSPRLVSACRVTSA